MTDDIRHYEGLQRVVQDYLGRRDLAERVPVFISLAEARLNRELRMRVMERRASAQVVRGQASVPLPWKRVPGDWDVFLEMRDLALTGNPAVNLTYIPPDQYGRQTAGRGQPRGYTIIGRDVHLAPAPDAEGELLMAYYAEIPPLGPKQPQNDVLLTCPDVYLYGALVESGPYTRASGPLQTWTAYYQTAVQRVCEQEQRARFTANLNMVPTRRV